MGTRNDAELEELFDNAEKFDLSFFSNNTAAEFFKHFVRHGTLQDATVLSRRLRRLLGNDTFLEAFQHSGELGPSSLAHSGRGSVLQGFGDLLATEWNPMCWPLISAAEVMGRDRQVSSKCLREGPSVA